MRTALLLIAMMAASASAEQPFIFKDVAKEAGLRTPLRGMMGHSAAWGDVNGDGWPDLFVGTFADRKPEQYIAGGAKGPVPNMLFMNRKGSFEQVKSEDIAWIGRAGGSFFADLDNDGDQDLYLTNNGRTGAANRLYENRKGTLVDVTDKAGPVHLPEVARSAAPIDYDGDGLLDLLVAATVRKGPSMLFRNVGGLTFEPGPSFAEDLYGLGVAVGDLDGDRKPDFIIGGSNRVYHNTGGAFTEVTIEGLASSYRGEDDAPSCGVALGDVNRDGKLDLLIGNHPKKPWAAPIPLRLFLNESTAGRIKLREVTEQVQLPAWPMKAPHVEIRDFDNDGLPDLYTAIALYEGGLRPVILRNRGGSFGPDPFADFNWPTESDYAPGMRTGDFYDQLVDAGKLMYFAPGPSADYNRDGRLDLFLPAWFAKMPSHLLKNETKGGNWIQVQVEGSGTVNRDGIGCLVKAYEAGWAGQLKGLISCEPIATGLGYTSGQPAVAHLGLGKRSLIDLVIEFPWGAGTRTMKNLSVNRRISVKVSTP